MLKKKKKQLIKVIVTLIDEKENRKSSKREYEIDKGQKVKTSFFDYDMKIIDSDGFVVKNIHFQAGFTKEYDFIYAEL